MASNDSSIAWRSLTKDSPLRPLRETYFLRPLRGAPPFVVMIAWASIRFPFLPSVASPAFFAQGFPFASPARGLTTTASRPDLRSRSRLLAALPVTAS